MRNARLTPNTPHPNIYTLTWHYHIKFLISYLFFIFSFSFLKERMVISLEPPRHRPHPEHADTAHHGSRWHGCGNGTPGCRDLGVSLTFLFIYLFLKGTYIGLAKIYVAKNTRKCLLHA
jgi:hypothetical protein